MADDIETRSADLGRKLEAVKTERATPTDQEIRERRAAEHATDEGTGLNSGKA